MPTCSALADQGRFHAVYKYKYVRHFQRRYKSAKAGIGYCWPSYQPHGDGIRPFRAQELSVAISAFYSTIRCNAPMTHFPGRFCHQQMLAACHSPTAEQTQPMIDEPKIA